MVIMCNFKMEKTMKKYIMLVAAALIFAACVKEEVNIPTGETEFISVELNVATKTVLNGLETIWSDGDKVSVTGESKLHLGYLTYDSGTGRFSGNITAGQKGNVTLNYPVDDENKAVTSVPTTQVAEANTFAEGAALLQGTITVEELRAGKGTTLNNTTALLQFKVAQAGDVTFEVGTKTYTVKGCQTGPTYYACVAPVANAALSFKIGPTVGEKSKSSVTFQASKVYNLGNIDILKYNVYVCISDLKWSSVNMHRFNATGDLTSWPGEKLSETVVVNGKTYFKKSIAAGETLSFTYNNGKASTNFKVDVKDVTVNKDIYYRLSARGAIEVNPNDKKTFGYAIYVFDQKSKNVAPNLYAWNDNNAWKNQYGGNFGSWPGVAFKNDCYYVPADGQNWKHYYYYEIPTALYGGSFKFIVNKSGQTSDIDITKLDSDLYVGYWYDSASSNGFWVNTDKATPITQ